MLRGTVDTVLMGHHAESCFVETLFYAATSEGKWAVVVVKLHKEVQIAITKLEAGFAVRSLGEDHGLISNADTFQFPPQIGGIGTLQVQRKARNHGRSNVVASGGNSDGSHEFSDIGHSQEFVDLLEGNCCLSHATGYDESELRVSLSESDNLPEHVLEFFEGEGDFIVVG